MKLNSLSIKDWQKSKESDPLPLRRLKIPVRDEKVIDYEGANDLVAGGLTIDVDYFIYDELAEVRRLQRLTYDKIITIKFESKKAEFLEGAYNSALNKEEVLHYEIRRVEHILDNDEDELAIIVRGGKRYGAIHGDEYFIVREIYEQLSNSKLEYPIHLRTDFLEREHMEFASFFYYLKWLKKGEFQDKQNHTRSLPKLPDCFLDSNYFYKIISNPVIAELYDQKDGSYYLKKHKKAYLAGFAHAMLNRRKLISDIKTSQDLAKVFCSFFNVAYNDIEDKQFQPDRAKTDHFDFIK